MEGGRGTDDRIAKGAKDAMRKEVTVEDKFRKTELSERELREERDEEYD